MRKSWPYLFGVVFIVAAVGGWFSITSEGDDRMAGDTSITLQLKWFHQAQFAGFYSAKANGEYNEEGLSVEINEGGSKVDAIKKLLNGEADIAIADADQVLIEREDGEPIKAIGTVYKQSLVAYMSRKKSGIKNPFDFIGKSVGFYKGKDTESVLKSMLIKQNIPVDSVDTTQVNQLQAFRDDSLDVFPAYRINEPLKIKREDKFEVNLIRPENYGIYFYSDTIVTTETYWNNNKDELRKFLRASARGWALAEANPDETITTMIRDYIEITSSDRPLQREMLNKATNYLRDGVNDQMFYMKRDKWNSMEQSLYDIRKIDSRDNVENLCDFDIVRKATKGI